MTTQNKRSTLTTTATWLGIFVTVISIYSFVQAKDAEIQRNTNTIEVLKDELKQQDAEFKVFLREYKQDQKEIDAKLDKILEALGNKEDRK